MLPEGVRLIHIRHGETDWNVARRLQGQTDTPMNDNGRAQARANGRRLSEWILAQGRQPGEFAYAVSPLARTRETMSLVRAALSLPDEVPTDARLKEVHFGEWAGFTYAELAASGQHEAVRRRKRDKWSFRPPGGESYAELAERVGAWLAELSRDTIAVAHGGVFRVLHGHLAGTPWHQVPTLPAPQDRVFSFLDGRVEVL